jgi:hypothetical protein
VTPFEVLSKSLAEPARCRFVHLLSGIATRHSDTIDCLFLVNGRRVTVAISCAAIARLAERERKPLSDQQLADIAALFLRRTLENAEDTTQAELFVGEADLRRLAQQTGPGPER